MKRTQRSSSPEQVGSQHADEYRYFEAIVIRE